MQIIELLNNWDTSLFLILNSLHSPFLDTVMWWLSDKYIWIPLYVIVLIYIIKQYKWKSLLIVFFIILLIIISDQVSVHLLKNVFQRLRPCHNPQISDWVHIVNNKCGGQFGFVSSHAANVFAFATFTAYAFRKKYFMIFIFLWAAIISYSRIYLGVHYPGDVIGGALLGIVAGFVVFKVYKLIKNRKFFG